MKQLLVLFGSWRNFDELLPHLDFKDYSVFISTWNRKWVGGGAYSSIDNNSDENKLTYEYAKSKVPKAEIIIHDFDKVGSSGHSTRNILFHWRSAIDKVKYLNRFDKIVFQRLDMISNLQVLKEYEIEKDCVYRDYPLDHTDDIQVLDWLFICHPYIVKKFMNMWPDKDTNYSEFIYNHGLPKDDYHYIWNRLFHKHEINTKLITTSFPKFLYTLMRKPYDDSQVNGSYNKDKHNLNKLKDKNKSIFELINEFSEEMKLFTDEWNRPLWEIIDVTNAKIVQSKDQNK